MTRVTAIIIGAFLASAAQLGLVPLLPRPLALIHLPLLVVTLLVTAFRFREAAAFALLSGAFLDLAAPGPSFMTPILLVSAGALVLVFTRVLTNSSLPALVGITVAGYAALHLGVLFADLTNAVLDGTSRGTLLAADRGAPLMSGALAQALAVIASSAGLRTARASMRRMFTTRRI